MKPGLRLRVVLSVLALLVTSGVASAQATRTWVSGLGDDVNPCSRTAPCKTFAGAISKTAAGGEISVLDPGGYGTLTITKSISIVVAGVEGSVLAAAGVDGIVINPPAGTNATVSLRGLSFEGGGSGGNGIKVLNGAAVHIEDCAIRGFTGSGILVQPGEGSRVHIRHVSIYHNNIGLTLTAPSTIVGIMLEDTTLERNTSENISVNGSGAVLVMSNDTLGGAGIAETGSPTVSSYGNNRLGAGGVITQHPALQ